jgi:hypothetical protein
MKTKLNARQLNIFELMEVGPTLESLTGEMLDAITNKLGLPNISDALSSIFESMEWAETEIAAAEIRHPDRAALVHSCFLPLQPSPVISTLMNERIYRAHVRELLDRVAEGKALTPATYAELCILFSAASLAAPLNQDGTAAYNYCFKKAFGEDVAEKYGFSLDVRPSHKDAIAEMLTIAARKVPEFEPRVTWDKEHKEKRK